MDINVSKTANKISAYNYQVLQDILHVESSRTENEKTPEAVKGSEDKNDWRGMPSCDMEMMLISSNGDKFPSSLHAVPKRQDNLVESSERLILARREMDVIQDKCRLDNEVMLKYFCIDFPGAQYSKDYYLERIKQLFGQCKQDGALLWYTGHGERGTGNWCFQDGVITFDDIFGLYMDHMRGKRLTIISDCSHSGQWVRGCAKKLDTLGILSCGHHTREQGILLKVFASCQENQEANFSTFVEAIEVNNDNKLFYPVKQLNPEQLPCLGDFRGIRCQKKPSDQCGMRSQYTWEDYAVNGSLLRIVRGNDRGKPAWYYLLVDREKVDEYETQVKTGKINIAKYGKVLYSGFGKDPPDDKKRMIMWQYSCVDPE